MNASSKLQRDLSDMAQDPEIQREIADIEEEFSVALMDGLSDDFFDLHQDS